MNLRRIEAFLSVAETGNVSRAAVQLEVAQSVISRHVAALEEELGSRLFERTGRGMALTSAGQHLAPRLRAALEAMQRAVHEAAELGEQPNGVVRMGVVPAATRPLVGLLYRRMNERFPLVRLQFVEGFSNEVEERLAGGSLDLAIVNRYNRVRRRGEETLCVVDSMVIGPPGAFPAAQPDLPFARLADYALVLASRPNALRVALDELCRRADVQLRVAVEADSLLTMKDLIIEGGLYTVLPRQLVHDELEAGSLSASRLVSPSLPRTLSLIVGTAHPASLATRTVLREIHDLIQSAPLREVWR
jgi:DNA-binding transcriptional LysR family regulator